MAENVEALTEAFIEVMRDHHDCGMWLPVTPRRWRWPCGIEADMPENLAKVGLFEIEMRHKAAALASRLAAPVPHPAATDPSDGGA